jgi:protein-disulfide isomerase
MSSDDKKKKVRKKKEKFKEDFIEKEVEETTQTNIPVAAAVPIIIFFFAIGAVLGGFFLPLGKKGKAAKCPVQAARTRGDGNAKSAGRANAPIKRVAFRIPADAPFTGPKNAAVSIVVFEDFECPYCKKATDMVAKVTAKFPKETRFVLMNFPLARHKGAQVAAEAGIEAMAQGKFGSLKTKMFANARKITKENIVKWGAELGMDGTKLKAALDSKKHEKAIKRQLMAGRRLGIRGTPTILVNGRKFNMRGKPAQLEASLVAMVKEELSIIKKRRIPAARAYATLTRGGVRNLAALAAPKGNKKGRGKKRAKPRTRKVVDPNVVYKVERDFTKEAWKGSKKPLVTILEFSDYQCPYCGRGEATMKEVLAKYKDDVQVVFMHNPLRFHKMAKPASNAAIEVMKQKGLAAFWKFHDHIFANRKGINPANLEKWAIELAKVDVPKFKKAMESKAHEAAITDQMKFGAKFGVRGTPAFFVNGYFVSGARPFKSFKVIIDREIAKAKKVIAAGQATRNNYYTFIMKTAAPKVKHIEQKIPARKKRPPRPRLDTTKTYKIDINGLPFFGDPNAPVVMAIGFDVQCPYCSKIMAIIAKLMDGEGDFKGYKTGLKVVLLHYPLPFHKDAQLAHEAMQEVFNQKGPAALYKFVKLLGVNSRKLPRTVLDKHAQAVGVDMAKFKIALDKNTHKDMVKKTALAARTIGVMGTPAVYLNGKSVRGRGVAIYRKLIDAARVQAETFIKANASVTLKTYYAEIMKKATPKAVWIKPPAAAGAGKAPRIKRLMPGQRPGRRPGRKGMPGMPGRKLRMAPMVVKPVAPKKVK